MLGWEWRRYAQLLTDRGEVGRFPDPFLTTLRASQLLAST